MTADGALVMANTQNVLRGPHASWRRCSALPLNKIRVQYYEGASSFGTRRHGTTPPRRPH